MSPTLHPTSPRPPHPHKQGRSCLVVAHLFSRFFFSSFIPVFSMLLVSRGIVLLTEFLAVTEDKCQVYHDMCGARFLPFSLLSTPTNFCFLFCNVLHIFWRLASSKRYVLPTISLNTMLSVYPRAFSCHNSCSLKVG